MLSRQQYDSLPREVSKILLDAQNKVIEDISRRIDTTNRLTPTSEYQLNRLSQINQFNANYRELLSDATGKTIDAINSIYEEAANKVYTYDKRLFDAKGIPMKPYQDNLYLQQLVNAISDQTNKEFLNLTQTRAIGFRDATGRFMEVKDYFVKKLDVTEFIVSTGAMSYDQAIKKVVKEMSDSGLRTVKYSGRTDTVEVSVRRAVMTGLGDIDANVTINNIIDLGVKHVQVSWHSTARTGEGINNHAGWQGRVYALNGVDLRSMTRNTMKEDPDYDDFVETTGFGDILGLEGVNCRHSFAAFDPEYQTPNYTEEELIDKEKKELEEKEYKFRDGRTEKFTRYNATQEMRKMEVSMRKQRALANGLKNGGDIDGYNASKSKYLSQLNEYKEFANSMGLQPETQRIYVDNLGGI